MTFPATAVGSSSTSQILFLQTTVAETLISPPVIPISQGGKQEYTVGTTSGCGLNSPVPIGTVCTIPVTFSPAYPGRRPVPLQINTSAGKVNVGLNGVGTGPLATFLPGTLRLIADAGAGGYGNGSGVGGPATAANINPYSVKLDAAGNVYFADTVNHYIGRIDAITGVLTSVAGQLGASGSSGDGGPATSATIAGIEGMALDAAGNVYLADVTNSTIRKVNGATGIISIITGTNGSRSYGGDGGPGTSAQLNYPSGMAVDLAGNIYVADNGNNVVRRIAGSSGIITILAGIASLGNGTEDGDGGQATAADLAGPEDVAIDSSGNIYIADAKVVRMVNPSIGIISTYAGSLTSMDTENNIPATTARLAGATTLAFDAANNLYHTGGTVRINKVEKASGLLRYFAGDGQFGNSPPEGVSATSTSVGSPSGVALDSAGNLYIADYGYFRVLKVTPDAVAFSYPSATNVGTVDTGDGARSIFLNNIGNAPLIVLSPTT